MAQSSRSKSKLTKNQELVFDALAKAGQPLGAYVLLDELRVHGFRALCRSTGRLINCLNWASYTVLESLNAWTVCGGHSRDTPVFAICNDCVASLLNISTSSCLLVSTLCRRETALCLMSIIEIHGQCDKCEQQSGGSRAGKSSIGMAVRPSLCNLTLFRRHSVRLVIHCELEGRM